MDDFTQVIDFMFTIWNSMWFTIKSYWILSFGVMVIILGYIVTLLKQSKNDK